MINDFLYKFYLVCHYFRCCPSQGQVQSLTSDVARGGGSENVQNAEPTTEPVASVVKIKPVIWSSRRLRVEGRGQAVMLSDSTPEMSTVFIVSGYGTKVRTIEVLSV